MRFRVRPVLFLLSLFFVVVVKSTSIGSTTTFTFTGDCTADCEGTATAQLVVSGYTPGNALASANLVSFTYHSDFMNFTVSQGDAGATLSGTIPASLPSNASVSVSATGKLFNSFGSGFWCAGVDACEGDEGENGVWNATAITLAGPTATAQVGVAYNSSVQASNGVPPYTYTRTAGSLPTGLSLNTNTGAITGTPQAAGPFTFTIQATDSAVSAPPPGNTPANAKRRTALAGSPAASTSSQFTITVSPATLTLTGPTTTAQVGVVYNSSLLASGGVQPYTFAITSGSLPNGLTLNTTNGAITGTPTQNGLFIFTARVTDSFVTPTGNTPALGARRAALAGSPATQTSNTFSITVAAAPLTLNGPNPNAQIGVLYNSSLTGNGGVPPYTFSITGGSLPPGLSLNTNTGGITGVPNGLGTFTFTGRVTDSQGSGNTPADRARRTALAGSPTTSSSSSFTITVTPGGSTFGAPALSDWMLVILAGAIAATGVILARRAQAGTSS